VIAGCKLLYIYVVAHYAEKHSKVSRGSRHFRSHWSTTPNSGALQQERSNGASSQSLECSALLRIRSINRHVRREINADVYVTWNPYI